MQEFESPFGTVKLLPLHHHAKSPLQAWSAADELLLKALADLHKQPTRLLVVNDPHGALATCLHAWQPISWNDSYCSKLAWQQNLYRNGLTAPAEHWLNADETPEGPWDVVLIKIPKSLALLEYQLATLRPHLTPNTRILGAGMVKHLSKSMIQCFERCLGPSQTSLAERKARLVHTELDPSLTVAAPSPTQYPVPGSELTLVNQPGVFSQQKLDIGTRFLLEHFPAVTGVEHILDLGCGNGVLACYAAQRNTTAQLTLLDDSWLALQSAKESITLNGITNPAHYLIGDGLDGFEEQVDLILCNPPFHEGSRLDSNIAQRRFKGAKRCLTPEGRLVIVGNRHLGYHKTLQAHFKEVTLTASSPKFVVLTASRPRR